MRARTRRQWLARPGRERAWAFQPFLTAPFRFPYFRIFRCCRSMRFSSYDFGGFHELHNVASSWLLLFGICYEPNVHMDAALLDTIPKVQTLETHDTSCFFLYIIYLHILQHVNAGIRGATPIIQNLHPPSLTTTASRTRGGGVGEGK
jgi:hypothetical protein